MDSTIIVPMTADLAAVLLEVHLCTDRFFYRSTVNLSMQRCPPSGQHSSWAIPANPHHEADEAEYALAGVKAQTCMEGEQRGSHTHTDSTTATSAISNTASCQAPLTYACEMIIAVRWKPSTIDECVAKPLMRVSWPDLCEHTCAGGQHLSCSCRRLLLHIYLLQAGPIVGVCKGLEHPVDCGSQRAACENLLGLEIHEHALEGAASHMAITAAPPDGGKGGLHCGETDTPCRERL